MIQLLIDRMHSRSEIEFGVHPDRVNLVKDVLAQHFNTVLRAGSYFVEEDATLELDQIRIKTLNNAYVDVSLKNIIAVMGNELESMESLIKKELSGWVSVRCQVDQCKCRWLKLRASWGRCVMNLKRILTVFCVGCAFAFPGQLLMAQNKSDVQVYIARDESPKQVLSYLLGLFGRDLAGSSNMFSRPVSGKFEVRSVAEVMSYFERAYNLNWFEYGLSIYVYRPSDWRSEKFYVGEYDSSTDWQELLANAGLQNSKFNVLYSNQKQELIVSGPESYIRLLKRTFEQTKPEEKEETY